MKRGHDPQQLMESRYIGTRVWRHGVLGIIQNCSTEERTVCVEWTSTNEPEWLRVDTVKRLRSAITRARNRQLAKRPKQLPLRYSG